MKKARFYMTLVALLAINMTMTAQFTEAERITHNVLNGLNSVLESQERKQKAELFAREKAQFKPAFDETMEEARELEEADHASVVGTDRSVKTALIQCFHDLVHIKAAVA